MSPRICTACGVLEGWEKTGWCPRLSLGPNAYAHAFTDRPLTCRQCGRLSTPEEIHRLCDGGGPRDPLGHVWVPSPPDPQPGQLGYRPPPPKAPNMNLINPAVALSERTLSAVLHEALRAHTKHADRGGSLLHPNHLTDVERLAALVEEVGEVARALTYDGSKFPTAAAHRAHLETELVQVANVALSWVQSLHPGEVFPL